MGRILMAWEMGQNYGHLATLLPVAEGLRAKGHELVFAVRDTRVAAEVLDPAGFRYVQAPYSSRKARSAKPPINYAEILIGAGYADERELLGMVQAWRQLIAMHCADAVLADHSPTALLAATIEKVDSLSTGHGFVVPPLMTPMPSIRPWEDISQERLLESERRINESIAKLATELGNANLTAVSELFGPDDLLATFPELDHYGVREVGQYIGPIFSLGAAEQVFWREEASRKILAYLRPNTPGFTTLLAALKEVDAEKYCVIPGMQPGQARLMADTRMRISLKPVSLAPLLERANLMISYGGGGVTAETLLSGTPMLISPRYVEQYLTGRRVEQLGAGMLLGSNRSVEAISEKLNGLLENPRYSVNAKRFAAKYADYRPEQAVRRIVDAVHARAAAGNVG